METVETKVINEIQRRIDILEKHKKTLGCWQVFRKAKIKQALKGYRESLNQQKDTHKMNLKLDIPETPFNAKDPLAKALIDILASPYSDG